MSAPTAAGPRPIRAARRGDTADHFRAMADFAPVMIWLAGPDRKSVYFNRLWLEFTGRSLDEQLGFGWMAAIHPEDRAPVTEAYTAAFQRRGPFEIQYRLRRHDGEYRWLLDKGVPLLSDGALAGFVGSCVDVTERIAAERARANAESVVLARDQFLAIVSHELRSPLNGIKSWTHVLQNQLRDADPGIRRALDGIMIGVEHQVRLIEDLLDVTRALSGNLGLAKESMALLPVLADAVESMRALAAENGITISTEYAIDDGEIHGDRDRIRQVFVNLIANAVKFTPQGGAIWLRAETAEGMARIEVRDNGAGIPAEFLPYVFDPFRQADQGASSKRKGLGLGLALVQRLTELHGGRVTCVSDGPARGASFTVYLPLQGDVHSRVVLDQALRDADLTASLPSLAGVGVLLIDDQREARESVAALLELAGARVHVAASCQEALECLRRGNAGDLDEVIVSDIAMPGEDGYATLKRIREWESKQPGARPRHRPAIALSAFTQREDRLRAFSEGYQMHLTKPVAPAELILVIANVARGMRV